MQEKPQVQQVTMPLQVAYKTSFSAGLISFLMLKRG